MSSAAGSKGSPAARTASRSAIRPEAARRSLPTASGSPGGSTGETVRASQKAKRPGGCRSHASSRPQHDAARPEEALGAERYEPGIGRDRGAQPLAERYVVGEVHLNDGVRSRRGSLQR